MFHPNANKIVTHVLVVLIIYTLLKVIPRTPLETKDVLVATIALYVLYLIVEVTREKFDAVPTTTEAVTTTPVVSSVSDIPTIPTVSVEPTVAFVPPVEPAPTQPPVPTMPKVEECTTCKVDLKDNTDVTMSSNEQNMIAYNYEAKYKYENAGTRSSSPVIANEMSYTDYNTIPVGAGVNSQNSDFTYTFLPPDRWYPVPPHPPVCVTETKCPVCPLTSSSATLDLKDWDDSRRITPGDVVNTKYVTEKLNSGR